MTKYQLRKTSVKVLQNLAIQRECLAEVEFFRDFCLIKKKFMGASESKSVDYVVNVDGSKEPGFTPVFRASTHPDCLVDNSVEPQNKLNSCWDLFTLRLHQGGGQNACIGSRVKVNGIPGPFQWKTLQEVHDLALDIGTVLLNENWCELQEYADHDKQVLRVIGLYSVNREEWFILEQAANAYNVTVVPLYDTLGEESIVYVLNQTKMTCCMASAATLPNLIKYHTRTEFLKHVICIDPIPAEDERLAKEVGLQLHPFFDVIQQGRKMEKLPISPGSWDSINTICYTSGTTGMPKGVILTHGMFISDACATFRGPFGRKAMTIDENDIHISYLPLAHVFERMICNMCYYKGAKIGVFSGDTLKLLDDIQSLNPSFLISVPRLYNRINDRVTAGVSQKSSIAQFLFNRGLSTKIDNLRKDASVTSKIWDSLVFNKTKTLMGTKMRFMVCGGAPLEASVQERMSALFCIPLIEGYGMTETMGATFASIEKDPLKGHIGGPMPCFEFRLQSIPEMEYTVETEPPRGELLIRGHGVTPGYFCNIEATREFLENGWAHTGDIAALLPNGGLKIIDRKKNLFKLSQGEYVCPERIEGQYVQCPSIDACFVFGYSTQATLVAVVVVNPDNANLWAKKNGLNGASLDTILENPDFKKKILSEMEAQGAIAGLKGFEKVKNIHLESEPFSPENGVLTPTFKIKRKQAYEKYQQEIDILYGN
eukprot:GHVP01030404.1.p1 GENE.GHVP01030404.1~~GHVP01030404.1.p1  ORF type:complete len:712 (-),score=96.41 GHVP01030404.1:1510-3645(-)